MSRNRIYSKQKKPELCLAYITAPCTRIIKYINCKLIRFYSDKGSSWQIHHAHKNIAWIGKFMLISWWHSSQNNSTSWFMILIKWAISASIIVIILQILRFTWINLIRTNFTYLLIFFINIYLFIFTPKFEIFQAPMSNVFKNSSLTVLYAEQRPPLFLSHFVLLV